MQRHERQRLAYDFLQSADNSEFAVDDLAEAAVWARSTAISYLSKQLKGLVEPIGGGRYRVRLELRRLTFDNYLALADQRRRVYQSYDRDEYASVVTYEFLLPLTHEEALRTALDDIFYSDTIARLIRESGIEPYEDWFPRGAHESDDDYMERLVAHAGGRFGGYSISHVSGRFRTLELESRAGAAALFEQDRKYLVDESTASVRFIIPIGAKQPVRPNDGAQLTLPVLDEVPRLDLSADDEVAFVKYLFFSLFVEALIRNVTGEDEIWLIEESPSGRRLHVWKPA